MREKRTHAKQNNPNPQVIPKLKARVTKAAKWRALRIGRYRRLTAADDDHGLRTVAADSAQRVVQPREIRALLAGLRAISLGLSSGVPFSALPPNVGLTGR
jgi:hypothetical protein